MPESNTPAPAPTPAPDPESFEQRIYVHLRAAYPTLDDDFIRQYPRELMEMLSGGALYSMPAIEQRARHIADHVPETLFDGVATGDGSAQPAAPAAEPTMVPMDVEAVRRMVEGNQYLKLINIYVEKVMAGEINGLCILGLRADGGHELMFTTPCDLFAYYGYMTHALTMWAAGQGGGEEEGGDGAGADLDK